MSFRTKPGLAKAGLGLWLQLRTELGQRLKRCNGEITDRKNREPPSRRSLCMQALDPLNDPWGPSRVGEDFAETGHLDVRVLILH